MAVLLVPVGWVRPAGAGQNSDICDSKAGASIPGGLLIDACYDGNNLVLENHSSIVLRANTDPYVAPPKLSPTKTIHSIASQIVINHEGFKAHPDPYLLPPDSRLVIPVGQDGNKLSIELYSDAYFYDIANILFTLSGTGAVSTAMVELVNDVGEVYKNFRDCLARNNFLGDAGCTATAILRARGAIDIAAAKGVLALGTGILKFVGHVVDALELLINTDAAVGDLGRFQRSDKTITISAREKPKPTEPPPTTTRTPETKAPPRTDPPKPNPTTPPTPPPTDPPKPPPTDPPSPPPSRKTYPETSGGEVHTWTNYMNAGGFEGPTVPKHATIQIECKIQGFAVKNGNKWWYRIAESPWNGKYYGSADAFYNNGDTSGSLLGTPYFDPAVPDC